MIFKTCCFTGHREISKHIIQKVAERLEIELVKLIGKGYCYFGCGGALGFDMISSGADFDFLREGFKQNREILERVHLKR